jgi:hypothetical protein
LSSVLLYLIALSVIQFLQVACKRISLTYTMTDREIQILLRVCIFCASSVLQGIRLALIRNIELYLNLSYRGDPSRRSDIGLKIMAGLGVTAIATNISLRLLMIKLRRRSDDILGFSRREAKAQMIRNLLTLWVMLMPLLVYLAVFAVSAKDRETLMWARRIVFTYFCLLVPMAFFASNMKLKQRLRRKIRDSFGVFRPTARVSPVPG